jgi:hypothetical protein
VGSAVEAPRAATVRLVRRGQLDGDDDVISDIDDFSDDQLAALAALVTARRTRPPDDTLAAVEDLATAQRQQNVERSSAKRRHPTAHRKTA